MNIPFSADCMVSSKEMDLDGKVGWSAVRSAQITFKKNSIEVDGVVIPYDEISRAVLNSDKTLFASQYSLILESERGAFVLNLGKSHEWTRPFPFSVERIETQDFFGLGRDVKRYLWVIGALLALSLIVQLLEAVRR